jgi:cytochrome c2
MAMQDVSSIRHDLHKINFKVAVTPERVARGQKIASVLCVECHQGDNGKLTGKELTDIPKEFGKIFSKNITNHPKAGIGNWTDADIYYLLRTGIGKDGKYIPPYMVKFPLAADEDLYDIIAWLRSDKPALQASDRVPPTSEPSMLTKILCNFVFKPLPMPSNPIALPDTTNEMIWGKYLVTAIYHCSDCHSADFKTNNELNPEKSIGFCGGGNPLLNKEGKVVKSSNITFSKNGIGNYSLNEFANVLRNGKKPNDTQIQYPMIPYSNLTDNEVSAIYAYLKSIPIISQEVQ